MIIIFNFVKSIFFELWEFIFLFSIICIIVMINIKLFIVVFIYNNGIWKLLYSFGIIGVYMFWINDVKNVKNFRIYNLILLLVI